MSTKDSVIEMIRRMPEDASVPEIMDALQIRAQINDGLRQLDAGEVVPHAEVVFETELFLAGIISRQTPAPRDSEKGGEFTPVPVAGAPISESILAERR